MYSAEQINRFTEAVTGRQNTNGLQNPGNLLPDLSEIGTLGKGALGEVAYKAQAISIPVFPKQCAAKHWCITETVEVSSGIYLRYFFMLLQMYPRTNHVIWEAPRPMHPKFQNYTN
jgi:hypothetical protein